MNQPDQIHADSKLDEMAAEWLFEREEGFAPGRAEAFAAWRIEDTRHAEALERVELTLALLEEMPAVRAPLEARLAGRRPATGPRSARRLLRLPPLVWTAGLAAALTLAFTTWWVVLSRQPSVRHIVTDTAAQRSLVLPDGSIMDMNTGSDVAVEFTPRERRIILARGEAHFQVAHDTARPFIVTAGGVSVTAVGTAFNVRLATGGVDVLVVEGKVELGQGEPSAAPPFTGAAPLLGAGERAQTSGLDRAAAFKIDKVDARTIRSLLTWQNPLTNFADVPLREVVARFNQCNNTQLTLADADLGERKIGGMIALDQVDAFVRLLVQDGDIVVDRRSAAEIVLRRAR